MKRKIALVLLLCILCAGCAETTPTTPSLSLPTQGPTEATDPPITADPVQGNYTLSGSTLMAGSWQTALRGDSGGRVTYNNTYAGTVGKDYSDPAYYTYREYLSSTGGMKWSPLTWETTADSYILNYTTTGFYRFTLNADLTGWTIVDEMAVGAPEDVTADYVGQYGIAPGDSAKAWKIQLNPNACWADGTVINADTYLYSYQQLLDGKMMNRRADSLYAGDFAIVGAKEYLYGQTGWENVGIVKTGEYSLVFVTTGAVADPDFYVPYYLSSTYLVYEPLWEACKTYFDADGNTVSADSPNIASITTNYSTSLDTSMSYGPYQLTVFEQDKSITLTRNELWYGYADGKHLGQYQADEISCQIISDQSTALLAFLSGELDSISLSASDMERYAASDQIRYIPQSHTTKLSFNTDLEALSARGAQILTLESFRTAFCLAIDRTRFAAAYTSAGVPAYGLLNSMYVLDPYTGQRYRDSDSAKNALIQLYGLTYGEGGDYATLEEAYEAITGYDPALARESMQKAYDQAVAAGLYDGESQITLRLSVYQNEDIYVQMYNALVDALAAACAGTDLEGKITLEMTVDADYYATMESGLTDIIFSTWGGSAYDPYGILYSCYCDGGVSEYPNQMEYGFDASAYCVTITLDGLAYTASLQDWARWCAGDGDILICAEDGTALPAFRDYDAATRCAIYSDLEWAYLSLHIVTPLYARTGATLLSRKGDYPTDQYLDLAEFGGIAFYTFHYTDTQWAQVKDQMQY